MENERSLKYEEYMTDEEITRIKDYISKLIRCQGNLSAIYSEYADIEKYYENDQEEKEKMPNTKVNILNANIEGQAAMIMEQEISVMTRGESADDDDYAEDARIGLDWTLRKNYFKRPFKQFIRRFLKFGNGALTVSFDPKALADFGLVKIFTLPLTQIYIDSNIRDFNRYQEAEYVAEAMTISKTQIIDIYGEEKAEGVLYGKDAVTSTDVFILDSSSEEDNTATLIKLWSRQKGKLRCEEFTGDGFLLYDSHKSGTRKENQKDSEESIKSYYKYVNDKYPIFIASLYEREGNFWAFGDGKLLLPLQKMINDLYDKIRICSRPNVILYDINADLDLSDYDDNSFEPRPFDGTMTNKPLHVVEWGRVNESWWRLLTSIHQEVQNITRFYNLMSGGSSGSESATESALQHQQGSMATDDKKVILESTLKEMLEYALGIMIEKYTEGRSFRVKEDKDEYQWVDFRKMQEIPVKIPATQKYINDFKAKNPDKEPPQWELLTGDDGQALKKNINLDVEIAIGAGLPKNKAFMSKFMQELSGVMLVDKDGVPKPAVFWDEFRNFLKKFMGLPISDVEFDMMIQQPVPQATPQAQARPSEATNSAQGQGLSQNQRPQMSNLSQIRKGAM
jgi:hypothetical protein